MSKLNKKKKHFKYLLYIYNIYHLKFQNYFIIFKKIFFDILSKKRDFGQNIFLNYQ